MLRIIFLLAVAWLILHGILSQESVEKFVQHVAHESIEVAKAGIKIIDELIANANKKT